MDFILGKYFHNNETVQATHLESDTVLARAVLWKGYFSSILSASECLRWTPYSVRGPNNLHGFMGLPLSFLSLFLASPHDIIS